MKNPKIIRHWVAEAVETLGTIKPEACDKIANAITSNLDKSADEVARIVRKDGQQLAPEEKKTLGLRSNALFSREALRDLTEKGLEAPLEAHSATILRASLSASRAERIVDDEKLGVSEWEVIAPFVEQCSGCKDVDGKIITAETAQPCGPHNCFRQACAITFAAKVDSISESHSAHAAPNSRPWWKLW